MQRVLDDLHAAVPAIAPSLLACDFAELREEIRRVERGGARLLHLDIMDGHFVPNLSFGLPVVEAVRRSTDLPLDVHLMISEPARYLRQFREAGADLMTVHIEVLPDPRPVLREIRALGAGVGISLNPAHAAGNPQRLPRSLRPGAGDERHARFRRAGVRAGGAGEAAPLAGCGRRQGAAVGRRRREPRDGRPLCRGGGRPVCHRLGLVFSERLRPVDPGDDRTGKISEGSAGLGMLQVVLIRPGCTDYDAQQRIQGSLDIPLNEQGANEVAQTAAGLRDKGIETIYSPVSQPALQTAEMLAKTLGVKYKKIDRLAEPEPGPVAGNAGGRRPPQAAQGLSPVAGAAGERLSARRRNAGRGRRRGCATALAKLLKRHKEGVIGLVLPEPLLSLARRFITHGELGDLWKAPLGRGRFEVLAMTPDEVLAAGV